MPGFRKGNLIPLLHCSGYTFASRSLFRAFGSVCFAGVVRCFIMEIVRSSRPGAVSLHWSSWVSISLNVKGALRSALSGCPALMEKGALLLLICARLCAVRWRFFVFTLAEALCSARAVATSLGFIKVVPFTFKVGGGLGWYLPLILSTFFQTLASSILLLSVDTYFFQEEFWESFCALWNIVHKRLNLILLLTVGCLFACFLGLQTLFLEVCAISIPPWNWGHLIISIIFRNGFCGALSDFSLPIICLSEERELFLFIPFSLGLLYFQFIFFTLFSFLSLCIFFYSLLPLDMKYFDREKTSMNALRSVEDGCIFCKTCLLSFVRSTVR